MSAEYVIYRKTRAIEHDTEEAEWVEALICVGAATGNTSRQALLNWYVATGEKEMGEYVVIPLTHHHELAPRAPQTRLVFE